MLMTYGNIYVAQVAMGADMNQLVKALREAEEYEGPLRRHSLHALPLARPQMRHGRSAGRNEARGRRGATGYSTATTRARKSRSR